MDDSLEEVFGILGKSFDNQIQGRVGSIPEVASKHGIQLFHDSVLLYISDLWKANSNFACRLIYIFFKQTKEENDLLFSNCAAIENYFSKCLRTLLDNRYKYEPRDLLIRKYGEDKEELEKHLLYHKIANGGNEIPEGSMTRQMKNINVRIKQEIEDSIKKCEALTKSVIHNKETWILVEKLKRNAVSRSEDAALSAKQLVECFQSPKTINKANFDDLTIDSINFQAQAQLILAQAKASQAAVLTRSRNKKRKKRNRTSSAYSKKAKAPAQQDKEGSIDDSEGDEYEECEV